VYFLVLPEFFTFNFVYGSEGAHFFNDAIDIVKKYDYSLIINKCLVFVHTFFVDFVCQLIYLLMSGLIQLRNYICTFQRYFCEVSLKDFPYRPAVFKFGMSVT